MLPDF
jgi:hypothetical protein